MKIVIDARIIFTTTGRYVYRLLEQLQRIDKDNQYVVLLMKKDFDRWDPTAKNFTKQEADFAPYTFAEQLPFSRLLQSLKPDLVHFTMPQRPLLYRGNYVVTIHDLTLLNYVNARENNWIKALYKQNIKPAVFKQLLRDTAKTATHIVTDTEFVRQQVIKQLKAPAPKVSAIYLAGEAVSTKAKIYQPAKGKRFLLAVGNAYPYKNLEALIRAFGELRRDDPDLYLVLVGKTDFFYEQLQALVAKEGIQNVIFTGFALDEELAWLYQHAELYVFPSLSEGFGLPGLEAMQFGLPVAASNATCLPEVYGDAAVYFEPHDPSAIAKVLAETLADKKSLTQLKSAGKAQIAKYSWEQTAAETLAVYKNALKQ